MKVQSGANFSQEIDSYPAFIRPTTHLVYQFRDMRSKFNRNFEIHIKMPVNTGSPGIFLKITPVFLLPYGNRLRSFINSSNSAFTIRLFCDVYNPGVDSPICMVDGAVLKATYSYLSYDVISKLLTATRAARVNRSNKTKTKQNSYENE